MAAIIQACFNTKCISEDTSVRKADTSVKDADNCIRDVDNRVKEADTSVRDADNCIRDAIIAKFSCVLDASEKIWKNTPPPDAKDITLFHSEYRMILTPAQFFQYLTKYILCSSHAIALTFATISGIRDNYPRFVVDNLNIYRLLLTGLLVCSKFVDDRHYSNASCAKLVSMDIKEMNKLEIEFLAIVNFNLHMQPVAIVDFLLNTIGPIHHCNCKCKHVVLDVCKMYYGII